MSASQQNGAPALSVAGVSRWYGNVVAVNDISFDLGPGITGLLGPNGAGKSTILYMLAGLLKASRGSVTLHGSPAWRNPDIYRFIGFVPEREAAYPRLSGIEFVRFSARLHGLEDVEAASLRALEEMDLIDVKDRLTGGYSKGMKQHLKIAAAIVHQPEVLLLDEPFNGTDPRRRLRMMDMLRRKADDGATVVYSSHILEEVERLAEDVLVIIAGRLAASGDFHAIRKLMADRPYLVKLRSSDDRVLGAALIGQPSVFGVELSDGVLTVRTSDLMAFALAVAPVARAAGVSVFELSPADESLESVFSYLVQQ